MSKQKHNPTPHDDFFKRVFGQTDQIQGFLNGFLEKSIKDTTMRIALATSKAELDAWDGTSSGMTIADDLYTIDNFAECTDSSYNSSAFEVAASASGNLGLQGQCGINITGLNPWEKRYVKIFATNSFGSQFGETLAVG